MQELSRGMFVVKYEDITLLDSIGEGVYNYTAVGLVSSLTLTLLFYSGEFGIVYKGRVSTAGSRSYKEVAVKTMKGKFSCTFYVHSHTQAIIVVRGI